MKIQITFKTPDVVEDSIKEQAEVKNLDSIPGIDDLIRKWFQYGEYVTVELDTETGTCVVVPND